MKFKLGKIIKWAFIICLLGLIVYGFVSCTKVKEADRVEEEMTDCKLNCMSLALDIGTNESVIECIADCDKINETEEQQLKCSNGKYRAKKNKLEVCYNETWVSEEIHGLIVQAEQNGATIGYQQAIINLKSEAEGALQEWYQTGYREGQEAGKQEMLTEIQTNFNCQQR